MGFQWDLMGKSVNPNRHYDGILMGLTNRPMGIWGRILVADDSSIWRVSPVLCNEPGCVTVIWG